MLGSFPNAQGRVKRPAISRSAAKIANGGFRTSDEVLSKYREDASRKTEEERLKKERADARVAKRVDTETFVEQTQQGGSRKSGQGGRGRDRGRGRGTGRGRGDGHVMLFTTSGEWEMATG